MCVMSENSHLSICCCFCSAGMYFLPVRLLCFFCFFFRFAKKDSEEKARMRERDKFIYDFDKRGELCKVLFYCSLKNHITIFYNREKFNIARRAEKGLGNIFKASPGQLFLLPSEKSIQHRTCHARKSLKF